MLLVTDIFPPDIGGPATFIPALGTALVDAGHRVTVVCRADDPRAPLREAWPFRLLRMPRRGGASRRARLLWTLWHETRRHDVVFSNGLERATAWACRAGGRSYTVKVVGDLAWERARGEGLTDLSLDEFQAAPLAGRPWRRWAASQHTAARRARRVITPSDYLRRLVLGWGVEPARAVTVHNGNTRSSSPASSRGRGSRACRSRSSGVGRVVNHKGIEFLLEALAGVDGAELDVVGDGPAAPRVCALASRLGVDGRARFHGLSPRADVLRHLARADVLVLPSEYEGLSHALLEAASAAGLACVASDRGGNPEIIEHGRSGLLWPYGRVDALRGDPRAPGARRGTAPRPGPRSEGRAARPSTSARRWRARSTARRVSMTRPVAHLINLNETPADPPFSGAENHLWVLLPALAAAGIPVELIVLLQATGPTIETGLADLGQRASASTARPIAAGSTRSRRPGSGRGWPSAGPASSTRTSARRSPRRPGGAPGAGRGGRVHGTQ